MRSERFLVREPIESLEPWMRAGLGDLIAVIPGGATADVAGVRIELIALELRSTGAILDLALTKLLGEGHIGTPGATTVRDDRGRPFELRPIGSGGTMYQHRAQLSLEPAIPPDSRRLSVTIDDLLIPGEEWSHLRGPWHLALDLPSTSV